MGEKIIVEDLTAVDYSYNIQIVEMVRSAIIDGVGITSALCKATELETYDALFSATKIIGASLLMLEVATEEQLDEVESRTKEINDRAIIELEKAKDEFKKIREERLNAIKKNAQ